MQFLNRLAFCLAALTASAVLLPVAVTAAGQATGGGAQAATADTSALPTKVAVVSIRDAMTSTQEGKKQFDALMKKFNADQDSLKTMDEEAGKMQADLNVQKDKLTAAERSQREKAIQAKIADRQKKLDADKTDFETAQEAVVNSLAGKLLDVLGQVANAKGYDLVLDVSNPQTPVMWARPTVTNLTSDLVAAYDSAYPQK